MRLWRISNHADLDGLGGLQAGGRWHYRGRPVVYTAENPAAALLEVLVHLEFDDADEWPDGYQLLEIEADDSISRISLDVATLPEDWRNQLPATQAAGSRWLAERSTALLWVPSAIAPHTANVLINPMHPDTSRLRIVSAERHPFDERLFRGTDAGV